ncbi:MAG: hypothetical protein ACTHJ5_06640 [Ilyomonas sp.]|jgi:hypothetical protein
MNSNGNKSVITMEADELKNLVKQVNETVADVDLKKAEKTFSTADLWKIQRERRTQYLSARPMLSRRATIV